MQFIKITNEGKISKAINPNTINSVKAVLNDPHGNKYTEISLSNQDTITVLETLETVIDILESQDYDIGLTGHEYKFEFKVM